MNILHVTNEFSKKNYSIASLIIHLFKFYDSSEDVNVKMALHPDDPPMPLFGLPRIVSSLDDYKFILNSYIGDRYD